MAQPTPKLNWYKYDYNLRPCLYYDDAVDHDWKKGLFHRWIEDEVSEYDLISRKIVTRHKLYAIVEDEDGYARRTEYVRFIDSKHVIGQYDYTVHDDAEEGEDPAKNT